MPSMTGMRMSISTTSGACCVAAWTASSPVPASATTSMFPVASSTALKPARIIGWSSAITTRSRAHRVPPFAVGQDRVDLEAVVAARAGGERAAEQGGALAHADEAVAARRRDGARRRRRRVSVTVSSSASAR